MNVKSEAELPGETVYHTTGIKITRKPAKNEYEVGQNLDKTGMEVRRYEKASPSNAKREIVMDEEDYQTEYDFSEPGRKQVSVSYSEWDGEGVERLFTDSFTVKVYEKLPEDEYYTTKIRITKKPAKTRYKIGEDLDTSGLEVTEFRKASPSNAVRKNILSENEFDLEYDLSVTGKRNVKVVYYGLNKKGEEKQFTDVFTVQVIEDKDDSNQEPENPVKPERPDQSDTSDVSSDSDDREILHQAKADHAYYNGIWRQDEFGWKLVGANGSNPVNSWALVKGKAADEWYFFDERGYMLIGWLSYKDQLYYLNPVSDGTRGRMLTGWQQIDSKWYYFSKEAGEKAGAMLKDTVTPDGFRVGLDGTWIQ